MIELQWRAGLDDDGVAVVRALASAAAAADGSAPLSDEVLLALRSPGAAHLFACSGPDLVGFAHLDPEGGGELVVHPGHRRAGLGTRIARAMVERAGDAALRVWAHGEHPGAVALAGRLGFVRSRELWQMYLDMPDAPAAVALPDGVTLRPFVVGADEDEFLRVNNAAFDWHPEQGGWGVEQVRAREAEPWFDAEGFLLAVDAADRLRGFHWTKVHTEPERIGEVYVLGVDPSAQGTGLGAALTIAGLRHLHARGLRRVLLYVESDNEAAVRVYRKLGFEVRHSDVLFTRAAATVG
ncbi:mycothiol synthase [Pseudonocardia hydrocarbonoxydans]|uniref:Mycothiol acetyltransferase n=1 Tax=Pseudonocardia hydrocarbonoxydans TaxID=76726 RepID=A0A4Y3WTH7_9PSEU|nr:mycothiol synthase [Pseudonocardia hydrocarbonoxydans]GEC22153.1 mycothiol acetyltransferase [Pseudonocardia hydrocarbonoxydans]